MRMNSEHQEPLISIVLPVYNILSYLPACMDCVKRQTYQNLEVILVDDGSTDGCGPLCDRIAAEDGRYTVYHKPNGGLSDARNYGIERARGEYITLVDPDDTIDDDYVAYLLQVLQRHHARMSICTHRTLYDNGSMRELKLSGDEPLSTERCLERMLYHDVIDTSAWGKLYARELFSAVRYPKGRIFEDIGTTYQLMMQCDEIAVGYETKYTYHFHNHSIVNGSFTPAKLDMLEMTDRMAADVSARFPELRQAVQRRQVYARISVLNQMLKARGYEPERQEIRRYIQEHRNEVLSNPKTPQRDRIAIRLLRFSYPLYRFIWLSYQRHIFGS